MEMGSWGGGGQKCPKYSELPVLWPFLTLIKGSVKSVQMISLRRWLNGVGFDGGRKRGQKYQECPMYSELPLL